MSNDRIWREIWTKKEHILKVLPPTIKEGSQRSQSKTWGVHEWEGSTRHAYCHGETSRMWQRGDGSCWSRNVLETRRCHQSTEEIGAALRGCCTREPPHMARGGSLSHYFMASQCVCVFCVDCQAGDDGRGGTPAPRVRYRCLRASQPDVPLWRSSFHPCSLYHPCAVATSSGGDGVSRGDTRPGSRGTHRPHVARPPPPAVLAR
jgi:hypothetical protein